jgi:endonuclease/exonuclease/phosphatase family metal-dependent hydrolase
LASGLFKDPQKLLARPPFVATFKCGKFDFTLITIHVVYGSDIKKRAKEVNLLADVVKTTIDNNGDEKDVLLLGDFNTPPTDAAWKSLQQLHYTVLYLIHAHAERDWV